jgi:large subunit ribosomal protein L9
MKVILTEYVYKHGVAGEVVNVADGFARNFLIPKRMAIPATKKNLESQEALRSKAIANRAEISERINAASQAINGVELVFGMKAGSNNKLYGSITSQMIKDALQAKTGLDINRRRISERPIRELGRYDVPVRLGDVSPVLNIVVVREEELQAYLAASKVAAEQAAAPADAASAEVAPVEEAPASN